MEPASRRDADALPVEPGVEARNGGFVEDRRPQPHAAQRAGMGPDPFHQIAVARHPVADAGQAFGEMIAPLADDPVLPRQHP